MHASLAQAATVGLMILAIAGCQSGAHWPWSKKEPAISQAYPGGTTPPAGTVSQTPGSVPAPSASNPPYNVGNNYAPPATTAAAASPTGMYPEAATASAASAYPGSATGYGAGAAHGAAASASTSPYGAGSAYGSSAPGAAGGTSYPPAAGSYAPPSYASSTPAAAAPQEGLYASGAAAAPVAPPARMPRPLLPAVIRKRPPAIRVRQAVAINKLRLPAGPPRRPIPMVMPQPEPR